MSRRILALMIIATISLFASQSLFSQDFPSSTPSPKESTDHKIMVKGTSGQGCVLFVSVTGSDKLQSGECTWRGKQYALIRQKDTLGALLPVALDTPPGAYKLTVTLKNNNESAPLILERVIGTTARNYGSQHIWLSQSQYDTYDDPQAEKDNNEIHKALSYYTTGITWEDHFIVPVNGHISTQFGLKRFYNNDAKPEYHRGVDISAGTGTPVAASQRGIVRFAKKNLVLHGNAVVIDHGKGIGTLYIHMNSIKVKNGDSVEQGDVIGTVGSTGVATGPHLHWAAYAHDEPIDPKLLYALPKDWLDR